MRWFIALAAVGLLMAGGAWADPGDCPEIEWTLCGENNMGDLWCSGWAEGNTKGLNKNCPGSLECTVDTNSAPVPFVTCSISDGVDEVECSSAEVEHLAAVQALPDDCYTLHFGFRQKVTDFTQSDGDYSVHPDDVILSKCTMFAVTVGTSQN